MTQRENPLLVLGVPKAALVREVARGARGDTLKLAEAQFRTMSRLYHPDLPDGDLDTYSVFGDAISELRNPAALEYYIDELLGTDDLSALYQRRAQVAERARDDRTIGNLVRSFDFADQFAILGVNGPTSLIGSLDGQRVVIDVYQPHRAVAKLASYDETVQPHEGFSYTNGIWSEKALRVSEGFDPIYGESTDDPTASETTVAYDSFITKERVTVVGFVSASSRPSDAKSSAQSMIESGGSDVRLSWQEPQHSWFLPFVRFERTEGSESLVLYKHGMLAVIDNVFTQAAME